MRKVLLSFSVLLSVVLGADKTRIAVMAFEAKTGVAADTAATVGDLLSTALINLKRFEVLDRANIDKVLKEQALQNSGCTASACAVKLGNVLNVQKMVVGSVARLGGKYLINVQFVDAEKGNVDIADKVTAMNDDDLLVKTDLLASKIADRTSIFGRILEVRPDQTLQANLGKDDGLAPGKKVRLLRYGKAMLDQSTGDFLGREVEDLGYA